MSDSDVEVVDHANAVLIGRCMKKGGLTYPPAEFKGDFEDIKPTRLYGIWSLENAERYGYALPSQVSSDRTELDAELDQVDTPAWQKRLDACRNTTKGYPVLGEGFGVSNDDSVGQKLVGLPQQIEADAYTLASATSTWKSARTAWQNCLIAHKLQPRSGSDDWGPVVPTTPKAAIEAAITDVRCKQRVSLISTLSSLEARYQQAYIDANSTALTRSAAKLAAIVRSASNVVGEGD